MSDLCQIMYRSPPYDNVQHLWFSLQSVRWTPYLASERKWEIVTYFLHLSSDLGRIQSSLSEIRYKRSALTSFRENRLRKRRTCVVDVNKIEFIPKLWDGTTLWKWWTPWQRVSYTTGGTVFGGLHTGVFKLPVLRCQLQSKQFYTEY